MVVFSGDTCDDNFTLYLVELLAKLTVVIVGMILLYIDTKRKEQRELKEGKLMEDAKYVLLEDENDGEMEPTKRLETV